MLDEAIEYMKSLQLQIQVPYYYYYYCWHQENDVNLVHFQENFEYISLFLL